MAKIPRLHTTRQFRCGREVVKNRGDPCSTHGRSILSEWKFTNHIQYNIEKKVPNENLGSKRENNLKLFSMTIAAENFPTWKSIKLDFQMVISENILLYFILLDG